MDRSHNKSLSSSPWSQAQWLPHSHYASYTTLTNCLTSTSMEKTYSTLNALQDQAIPTTQEVTNINGAWPPVWPGSFWTNIHSFSLLTNCSQISQIRQQAALQFSWEYTLLAMTTESPLLISCPWCITECLKPQMQPSQWPPQLSRPTSLWWLPRSRISLP